MRLCSLQIQNYKSLRRIRFRPSALSVIVGANASGKSNLSDAVDFLSEVYRHGLEVAVARKGGFENIAFRRMRRSKGAITFQLVVQIDSKELRLVPRGARAPDVQFTHEFALGVRSSQIRAEYEVLSESLHISFANEGAWTEYASIIRERDGKLRVKRPEAPQFQLTSTSAQSPTWNRFLDVEEFERMSNRHRTLPQSELFVTSVGRYTLIVSSFIRAVSGIRVFQVNPTRSREFGVPIPRAELEVSGANLPAVVDLMKRQSPAQWERILQTMRIVLPSLKDIVVDYTSSRTLGLYFDEEGVGRPWSVGEVSDGTIQTLALLVALFDERFSALILEEPENSVHPWIIRHLLSAAREASKDKQVVITTHSPIVINAVDPSSLHVMWRSNGESHLASATALDPGFLDSWKSGAVSAFDFLDSGALDEAIPPAPNYDEGE